MDGRPLKTILQLAIVFLLTTAVARTHKTFPATATSVLEENIRAERLGLNRYLSADDVASAVSSGQLLPLGNICSPRVPEWRRYARTGTILFVNRLDTEFYDVWHRHLTVDSAVRPADVQRALRRHNRSAAPAEGDRASSHERGTTVDFSRRMSKREYRWLIGRLLYYRGIGVIHVIEERACLHVFVGGQGVQTENQIDELSTFPFQL